jgi:cellulose synthase/poly-beta-1,6-N-acetylglucosamine synthase-like glycosyltransferase
VIEILLGLAVLPLALPALSLLALTLAAVRRPASPERPLPGNEDAPRVAILVPAHNESTHVLPTIACLRAELGPTDRLVVVADNCDDDTAALARGAGATVVERRDAQRRGKGYALAFGVDSLRADPPDVVLVVDADCVVSEGAVAAIARECAGSGKPAQMLNLMRADAEACRRLRVLEFAMVMKNLVRPLGSFRLGRACHLMGTGMALPWALISTAELATGHVAEDMKLGVELTRAGFAPQFLPDVRVTSAFVRDAGAARVQKSRWEHGHLATLSAELPRLLSAAVARRDPALLVLAMDLMIPPVAFYFLLLAVLVPGSALAAWFWPPFRSAAAVAGLGALSFVLAVVVGWFRFARHRFPAREFLSLPLYALWKLPVYVAYFVGKRSSWVRTRRDAPAHPR